MHRDVLVSLVSDLDDQMTADARERQARHAVLARALLDELEAAWAGFAQDVVVTPLRVPETGLVMLRGRIAGTGAPFNFGEASVSRCAVSLRGVDDGAEATGVGYTLGRQRRKAELIAAFDALAQLPRWGARVEREVLAPLRTQQQAERAQLQARTAASKVEFFTMVRGEG
jgi:alpha-D-ribose 1-methylphosphonate 5-triphosphate synthase subunit PhnG